MILSVDYQEVVGTLKVTLRGFEARDMDGRLIARSWNPRRVGRAVEAHVLLEGNPLPF